MRFLRLLLVISSLGLLLESLIGETARAANPAVFTVAGLRLYMTPHEILEVLKLRSIRSFDLTRIGCYRDIATAIARAKDPYHPTVNPHCIGSISAATVRVAFIEDYPFHPGTMRAYSIEYSGTAGDADILKEALRNRYGAPTWTWNNLESWCDAPPGPIKGVVAPVLSDPCGINDMPFSLGPDLDGTIRGLGGFNMEYPAIALKATLDVPLLIELHDKRFAFVRNSALIRAQNAAIKRATRTSF